jgi:hypothetical protein
MSRIGDRPAQHNDEASRRAEQIQGKGHNEDINEAMGRIWSSIRIVVFDGLPNSANTFSRGSNLAPAIGEPRRLRQRAANDYLKSRAGKSYGVRNQCDGPILADQ